MLAGGLALGLGTASIRAASAASAPAAVGPATPVAPAARSVPLISPVLKPLRVQLPGLQARAEILVDPWGVPHLYAASSDDLFFVQGFNAARDRLFQIDLWRRRGLGRLAAALGPAFAEQDRAARLFLYRGNMQAEWRAYAPGTQQAATRFVAGINAYIDLLAEAPAGLPAQLPFEFRHFGYRPEKWAPEDVVRIRSHALSGNVHSELWRTRAGLPRRAGRRCLAPGTDTAAHGACARRPGPLRAAAGAGRFCAGHAASADAGGRRTPRSALERRTVAPGLPAELPQGSNAWVVAPSRSATGRPLLASDPHRLQAAPSLRYLVHLEAPGLSAIGAGEPALPGVSLGHNGRIAFGLTVFGADQEDLYVYETRAGRPDEYRYQGRWEAMRVLTERIEVRGAPAQTVRLRYTRHGPVTWQDSGSGVDERPERRRRWPRLRRALGVVRARHGALPRQPGPDARRRPRRVHARDGRLGHAAGEHGVCRHRRRHRLGRGRPRAAAARTGTACCPCPATGVMNGPASAPPASLPALRNPAAGWFASANEYNLPATGPWVAQPLGLEWPSRARHDRLAEVLAAQPRGSVEDAMRLQNDLLSVPARRLQALLRPLRFSDVQAQAAQRLLLAWHLRLSADSAAAALFERWWSRHLPAAFRQAVLPTGAGALLRSTDEDALLATLEQPATLFSVGAMARRDALLERSLASAWAETAAACRPRPRALAVGAAAPGAVSAPAGGRRRRRHAGTAECRPTAQGRRAQHREPLGARRRHRPPPGRALAAPGAGRGRLGPLTRCECTRPVGRPARARITVTWRRCG